MQKILVTTDFSKNSIAGILFAIQLATQQKIKLFFFHVHHALVPTAWDAVRMAAYEKQQMLQEKEKLETFIQKIYASLKTDAGTFNCVVKNSVYTEGTIMEYAKENHFDYICISTRGAGQLKRLFGTNTANLITQSEVPVIAVPYSYKSSAIKHVLYASDLLHLEQELKHVMAFAKPLKATVELLHFTSRLESPIDAKQMSASMKKLLKYDVKINIKDTDFVRSMIENIERSIKKTKPSILIMFTEQNRTFFQKIFISSKAAEYSFNATVPLLVFNKS